MDISKHVHQPCKTFWANGMLVDQCHVCGAVVKHEPQRNWGGDGLKGIPTSVLVEEILSPISLIEV